MAMVNQSVLKLSLDKVPLLKVLFPFVLGIYCAEIPCCLFFLFRSEFSLFFFILWVVGFCSRKKRYGNVLGYLGFYLFWFALGGWITIKSSPSFQKSHFSHYNAERLLVIIEDEPQIKGKTVRFPVTVKSVYSDSSITNTSGKLMMTVLQDSLRPVNYVYGDVFVLKNKVTAVDPPFNPYQFNFKEYLINKDIWHQCFLTNDQLEKIDKDRGNIFLAWTLRIRENMIQKFALNIKDKSALQLASALIFGFRSEIDEHTVNVFTNTGTVHILSVSGLHVAMVFGLLTFLLTWLDRFPFGKQFRILIIFLAVWLYVILTGMSPPILRAGIMISFFMLSLLINRQQVALNTLFASALFILLFSPKSLFDIGFQLSYLAVIGILLLFPLLKSLYLPSWKWSRLIVEYCYVSVAAQLFTLPAVLYYFGQFPTYFIPANLFIALPSALIMYFGVALAISPFAVLNKYIGEGLNFLLLFSIKGLGIMAEFPKSVVEGIFWNSVQAYLVLGIILIAIWAWNFREKNAVFIAVLMLIFFSFTTNIYHFRKREHQGHRIYNVRSDIAIAAVVKGKAAILSTFDSIEDKSSRFSFLPDISRFVSKDKLSYTKLDATLHQNYLISLAGQRVLVLETDLTESVSMVDVVLWRNNNRNTIEMIQNKVDGDFSIVVDGSNSEKTISMFQEEKRFPEQKIYILKNNFAYVWDKE